MKVLLIEDLLQDIRLMQEAIAELEIPCQLLEAQSGREAFKILHKQRPDLIFLDLNLPEMSGHEILAIIKRNPQWRDIPVVILSTSGASTDVERSYELQVNGYLVKPFDFDQLVDTLRSTLHYWDQVAAVS